MNPNVRKPDETREEYKARRKEENINLKNRIRYGRLAWVTSSQGTYVGSKKTYKRWR